MNNFALSTEHQALLDHADKYAREQLYPLAAEMDNNESWPKHIMQEVGELVFLGTTVSPKYGGAGMSLLETGLILRAFSRWNHAFALSWVVHDNLCMNNIFSNASDTLKTKYLPKLCTGEHIGCLGLTEPEAGSDALGSMKTRAIEDGDDYLISGNKLYITNGPIADICLLYAKTQANAGSKGITAFLIETQTAGFSVAQKLIKMDFRGSQTTELVLDNVRVAKANIIGQEHQGHKVVMGGLDIERALIALSALALPNEHWH